MSLGKLLDNQIFICSELLRRRNCRSTITKFLWYQRFFWDIVRKGKSEGKMLTNDKRNYKSLTKKVKKQKAFVPYLFFAPVHILAHLTFLLLNGAGWFSGITALVEWHWTAVTPGIKTPEVGASNEFTEKGTGFVGNQEFLEIHLSLTWKR